MIKSYACILLVASLIGPLAKAETREETAMKGLYLREFRPYFSEYGDYLQADFKLQNTSAFAIKDIVLQCTTDGATIEEMSVIVIPVFRTIGAHQTLTVRDFDLRDTPYMSDRVVCGIIGLALAFGQISASR
jgi:hypothetical protein